MNSVILIGNLGADPETKQVGETTKGRLRLATSERAKVDGAWQKVSCWHTVILWGKSAEIAEQYAKKGSKICVRGRIAYNTYTDKQGNERTATEIVADEIELLGGREEGDQRQAQPASRQPAQGGRRPSQPSKPEQPSRSSRRAGPPADFNTSAENPDDLPF